MLWRIFISPNDSHVGIIYGKPLGDKLIISLYRLQIGTTDKGVWVNCIYAITDNHLLQSSALLEIPIVVIIA